MYRVPFSELCRNEAVMNDTISSKVTLILPVRRAGSQVIRCLRSIHAGTVVPEIFLMDCTAAPGALEQVRREFPQVRVFDFGMNPGRAHAVNTGIHLTRTPYVMTFSPGLAAGRHCIERLCRALDEDSGILSAQARIMSAEEPARISGAGWGLSAGAHPVIRGKGARASHVSPYAKKAKITAAQMEAAVYRMEYLEVTGILDERYYGRLEDLDLGYRGMLCGFDSIYEPQAVCREMAGTEKSGFYSQLETGNMVYFRYKFGIGGFADKIGSFWERTGGIFPVLRKVPGTRGDGAGAAADQAAGTSAAVERGRMLCFQAEMELMEREELGMSATKQTLPEEFCLKVREDGPGNVYPLYVGERQEGTFPDLRGTLRVSAAILAGTGDKLFKLLNN